MWTVDPNGDMAPADGDMTPAEGEEPPEQTEAPGAWGEKYLSDTQGAPQAGAQAAHQPPAVSGPVTPLGRTPKAVRPVRGPKFGGGGVPGGCGILSLLITILIMAIMGMKVLSGVGGGGDTKPNRDKVDVIIPGVPGGPLIPGDTDPGDGDTSFSPSAADAAREQACNANRATLETAVAAYEMTNGEPPADQEVLVDSQFLKELVPNHTVRVDNGAAVIEGTDGCS